jgi:hypothetical protein
VNYNRRQSEGALRFAERRKREDEAPRLSAEVPGLQSLALEIEERTEGGPVAEPTHVRRVVVEHAPALFVLSCGEVRCKDGGHDVTYTIMRALRAGETRFEGQDVCNGSVGTGQCSRVLRFVAVATYT